jgi:hypothetical protein
MPDVDDNTMALVTPVDTTNSVDACEVPDHLEVSVLWPKVHAAGQANKHNASSKATRIEAVLVCTVVTPPPCPPVLLTHESW